MSKRILVPVANGSEEMETVIIVDTLVRAGFQVTMAAVDDKLQVQGSRGVWLTAEQTLEECSAEAFDALALPGGVAGAQAFADSTPLLALIDAFSQQGKLVAAICATPALVFTKQQKFVGARMTCHPNFFEHIPPERLSRQRVCYYATQHLLTSQGPGTALEFALAMIALLAGLELAQHVAAPMVLHPQQLTELSGFIDAQS
ncbi:DJ-1/PfpI family protein [Vibrio cholerae]|uniref:DJ-1 family glyoxalase III n=1 Tax=Vibrio cholerae TaxID=666 RepID=UPI0002D8109F|nr:DJ-1 family glyoxalase III [Vibrio cholerae]MDA5325542.1 DJ-1/PfpI family protein [Vibrio cholerae]HDI3173191.1 DJ-1/PfpI family protein [Vibrio cholerae]HDI3284319.1 DJ-1/PfpI family protein [Vibrio cholerae]